MKRLITLTLVACMFTVISIGCGETSKTTKKTDGTAATPVSTKQTIKEKVEKQ